MQAAPQTPNCCCLRWNTAPRRAPLEQGAAGTPDPPGGSTGVGTGPRGPDIGPQWSGSRGSWVAGGVSNSEGAPGGLVPRDPKIWSGRSSAVLGVPNFQLWGTANPVQGVLGRLEGGPVLVEHWWL